MTIWYGIDMAATGANIRRLRQDHGLSVRDIQEAMGFDSPSAVYKWEQGLSLPSIEHMMALSKLFDMRMEDILIWSHPPPAEELSVTGGYIHTDAPAPVSPSRLTNRETANRKSVLTARMRHRKTADGAEHQNSN